MQTNKLIRPTYAQINLNNLLDNYKTIKSKLKKTTKILAVVKANAYGHGSVECAKHLEKNSDINMFGVATIEEGIELRENGITTDILVLGSIYPFSSFEYILKYNLTPTIASIYLAEKLSEFCQSKNKTIKIHLKIDTGMGRIGISPASVKNFSFPNIEIEGVYTHIASNKSAEKQITIFNKLKKELNNIKYFHLANTETICNYKNAEFDMVRIGLALYGLYENFKPVMSLKSKIVFLKTVPPNTPISYGGTYVTHKTTKIATIAIGYADGYKRAFSNQATGFVHGQKIRQIGTICMDMCMFDVTDIQNIEIGDEIELINEKITVNDLAKMADTIPYEIVTQITNRVPRVY